MLDALVRELYDGMTWGQARSLIKHGKVQVDGAVETEQTRKLRAGSELAVDPGARRLRPDTLPVGCLLHVDHDIVVVDKPAGLMTVPFEGETHTLVDRVRAALQRRARRGGRPQPADLGVVQRLDKDTTGVLVFARTLAAKRHLQQQFRAHSIERRYLAIAHGQVQAGEVESMLVRDRGDGLKGSHGHYRRAGGPAPANAQRALTHLRPLSALRQATLVECTLHTGRQHQIRIHLSERGHPLVGEEVYIRDFTGRRIAAPRIMLHAAVLGFVHPRSGKRVRFEREPPVDFRRMLERLG